MFVEQKKSGGVKQQALAFGSSTFYPGEQQQDEEQQQQKSVGDVAHRPLRTCTHGQTGFSQQLQNTSTGPNWRFTCQQIHIGLKSEGARGRQLELLIFGLHPRHYFNCCHS